VSVTPPYLTEDQAANDLLCENPLALLLGMMLDQQIPMERAFGAPYLLTERLGTTLIASEIAACAPDQFVDIFSQKPALHRFPRSMAQRAQLLCSQVEALYSNDAARIWDPAQSAQEVLKNLQALPGFGPQKAKIFLALLAKRFGITPTGWVSATDPFGEAGTFMSVADIDSLDAFAKVRSFKAEMKNRASAQ
jgi:uncharacterized HhH-GPD family protein